MNYSLRTMIVGIALILMGIYIQNDLENDFYENDYLLVIAGFVLVIVGCFKEAIKTIIVKQEKNDNDS
ncbi:hypothetical protein [Paenibacillus harenae]|uniref:Membrane protein n=1 Tax=Paenibacillus harenae TaxID=306543 RepID=A0ABT9UAD5_PAEHA|nr:hypothetical protein [Paenibacillus harenae]MDQ0116602.1 putative membrane protein [Paenibacillus harenae]